LLVVGTAIANDSEASIINFLITLIITVCCAEMETIQAPRVNTSATDFDGRRQWRFGVLDYYLELVVQVSDRTLEYSKEMLHATRDVATALHCWAEGTNQEASPQILLLE
jgi:hypothetical protein